mmetsp:Transcript_16692/g.14606  ORF Transcript_16692/g.14606 Transcript_16692/m.14606 type:complete len:158 (+) Transcript_16692:144-617(+)
MKKEKCYGNRNKDNNFTDIDKLIPDFYKLHTADRIEILLNKFLESENIKEIQQILKVMNHYFNCNWEQSDELIFLDKELIRKLSLICKSEDSKLLGREVFINFLYNIKDMTPVLISIVVETGAFASILSSLYLPDDPSETQIFECRLSLHLLTNLSI